MNWLVAIPADVVKSRLQSAPNGTYSGMKMNNLRLYFTVKLVFQKAINQSRDIELNWFVCVGTIDCLQQLLKEDGAKGLYRGAVPVLLR